MSCCSRCRRTNGIFTFKEDKTRRTHFIWYLLCSEQKTSADFINIMKGNSVLEARRIQYFLQNRSFQYLKNITPSLCCARSAVGLNILDSELWNKLTLSNWMESKWLTELVHIITSKLWMYAAKVTRIHLIFFDLSTGHQVNWLLSPGAREC